MSARRAPGFTVEEMVGVLVRLASIIVDTRLLGRRYHCPFGMALGGRALQEKALTVRHPKNEVMPPWRMSQPTMAVLRGVEGNKLIEQSFLLTIHAFRGLYQPAFVDFFDAKGGAFK